jgi:hypothetical protein
VPDADPYDGLANAERFIERLASDAPYTLDEVIPTMVRAADKVIGQLQLIEPPTAGVADAAPELATAVVMLLATTEGRAYTRAKLEQKL